jgi:hypothetical protein
LLEAGLFAFVDTLLKPIPEVGSPDKPRRSRAKYPPNKGPVEKDAKTGRFLPGNNGGPGRQPGSRRDLEQTFVDAVVRNFALHGEETIERVRQEDPSTYLRVAAGLLPREMNVNVRSDLGIDTFVQRVRELAARGAGRNAGDVARIPPTIDQEPTNGVGDHLRLPPGKPSSNNH